MQQADTTRIAPHSVEAEEAVLGSILIDAGALHDVLPFLESDDFFITKNGWVWDAILRVHRRGELVDYLTVVQELREQGRLTEIGGPAYVTYLINHTPSSLYAEAYGRIVQRAAIRRRMLAAASEIARLAHDETRDVHAAVDEAEAILAAVTDASQPDSPEAMKTIMSTVFDAVDQARTSNFTGIPTGFHELDALLGGLQKSDLVIVAGRPGMGKSAWLQTVALFVARQLKKRVFISSLEMSKAQVAQRLIAMETGVSTRLQRTGKLDDDQFARFTSATDRIGRLPIFVDDQAGLSPFQLQAKVQRIHNEHGLDLVMVDYLQLMKVTGSENRTQEIGEVSRSLKELARLIDVPVIAAAQLSRAVENRSDKRPVLSDLRESGSIEQDADIVMFLYREEVYNEYTDRKNSADVIVAKHRNGPTGIIPLYYRKEVTQFVSARREQIDLGRL